MITAFVQFEIPEGTSRDDIVKAFNTTTPKYQGLSGLVRKYYLIGEEGTAGGAYLWESREAAEAVYTAEWRKMIAERYGSEPIISYFETPVIVDNATGDVVKGAPE